MRRSGSGDALLDMDVDDLASLSLSLPSDGTDASADEQALSLLAAAGDKINGKANA